jgi:hypothetical protein
MALRARAFGKFARICAALFTLAALLVTNVAPTFAAGGQTGNLRGVVVDASTRMPIAGATVSAVAPSGRYGAKTDAQGRFSILGLTVDTYTIVFSQSGYSQATINGVNIVGDNTVNLQAEALEKSLQTIGRARSRSASSATRSPSAEIARPKRSGKRIIPARINWRCRFPACS